MKSIDFIKNRLKELYKMFNYIKIRYNYNPNTNSHLVEIIPLSFFETNKEYIDAEIEFEEEFEMQFPEENIIFISENSLSEINNPIFELGYEVYDFFTNETVKFEVTIKGFEDNINYNNSNNYSLAA